MQNTVFTIGHSTYPIDRFLNLLTMHSIQAICDVRSKPYSRMNPQFNREKLKESLREFGIKYVFLGAELGARSEDPCCYHHGKVQYERLAQSELFKKGLDRIKEGAAKYRLALMCAEKEPLECHRTILVARYLEKSGLSIEHILSNGTLENHSTTMKRLINQLNLRQGDIFSPPRDVLEDAYKIQGEIIAYSRTVDNNEESFERIPG